MVQTNNAFTTTDGPGVIPAAAQFTPVEVAHLHLVAAFKEMTPWTSKGAYRACKTC